MIHSNVPLLMKVFRKKIVDLIDETGVDKFTIQKARSDKRIASCRLESLCKIAAALNVELEDLYEEIQVLKEESSCTEAE